MLLLESTALFATPRRRQRCGDGRLDVHCLNPSQYYMVETTWTKNTNRASNAPYTISGGTATLPVAVNQQLSPVGVSADNWTWQELGVYQPASGSLAVTLSNNSQRERDRRRRCVEPVPAGGPAIMVQAGTGNASDPVVLPTLSGTVQTAVNFGTVVVGRREDLHRVQRRQRRVDSPSSSLPAGYTLFPASAARTLTPVLHEFVVRRTRRRRARSAARSRSTPRTATTTSFSFPVTVTVSNVAPTAAITNSASPSGKPGDGQSWQPLRSVERGHGRRVPLQFRAHRGGACQELTLGEHDPLATYTFAAAGTYTVWGRILDANGLYTDYSTQVTVNALPMVIMTAGAPNFQRRERGRLGSRVIYPQGYADDDQEAMGDSSSTATATATWTFNGLTAGATYQVYVTWPINRNRATNVPYTVTAGAA